MKNTAINNLSYTGIVTLSQCIGDKKIKIAQLHNAGGTALFRFFANCLIGNFPEAQTDRPAKIMLLDKQADGSYESVSGFIFKRSAESIKNNLGECRVCYSFMVPRDFLENITSISTLCLGLYGAYVTKDDLSNFIALCNLGSNGLELTRAELTHASLIVDWELVISNKTREIIVENNESNE
jgi:hypothetical protein